MTRDHCDNQAHTHEHSHHGHSHSPPPGTASSGDQHSLFSKIDRDNVVALNAKGGEKEGRNVIKAWDQREEEIFWCESDVDDSLIISIPFIAQVKLTSITIKSGPAGLTPSKMRIYINSPGLDFSDTSDRKPVEEMNLIVRKEGVEYAVRPSKFSQIRSLQLHFPSNITGGDEEETTRIYYIGLKGEWSALTKNPEGIILYEANANPADHKVKGVGELQGSGLGM